ncbi:Phage protein GP46 [Cupriavidus sp. H19C3]|uniref:phage GP46 family protein n=1 Tax=Cupriavidus sp. H19C3 TaxID=3241603 RepID=UPI003BF839DF
MDALLDPLTGSYDGSRTTTLSNAVYLRLQTPLGSWWADPSLGSRLHELKREKDTPRVAVLAKQYAEQALQPLIADGRAQSIAIDTLRLRAGWLLLLIEVRQAGGQVARLQHPVRVV